MTPQERNALSSYQELEIRIFPADAKGEYPVELSAERDEGFPDFPASSLRLSADAEAGLLRLQAIPGDYGLALGQLLFSDPALSTAYQQMLAAVSRGNEGLRVRLRLDLADLSRFHWERIYHPLDGGWQPLAITARTPFSRYAQAQRWDRAVPLSERPLRVLAVIASPADLSTWNLDPIGTEEHRALHDTLDRLRGLDVQYLESGTASPPTLPALRKALQAGYHVVHFLCHGAARPAGNVLYLEDEEGRVAVIEGQTLVESFAQLARAPLLCFLAACESAARSRSDAFMPFGPRLVQEGGVQAVVAMTGRVGMTTARNFADQFYSRLLVHGIVDVAVNEARALVQDNWDWSVPVLFSRLPDNQLLAWPSDQTETVIESTVDRILQGDPVNRRAMAQVNVRFDPRLLDEIAKRVADRLNVGKQTVQDLAQPGAPEHVSAPLAELIAAQKEVAAHGIQAAPEALYRLGMLAAFRRDYEVALDDFRQATQLDADYADAYEAIAWLQQGRAASDLLTENYDAAAGKLSEATEAVKHTDPLNATMLALRGYISQTRGQLAGITQGQQARDANYAQAAEFFEHALQLNPGDVSALNGVGNAQYNAENYDAAIATYRRVLKLSPDYPEAIHDLALAYEGKMRSNPAQVDKWRQKALETWQQFLEQADSAPAFTDQYVSGIKQHRLELLGQREKAGRRRKKSTRSSNKKK